MTASFRKLPDLSEVDPVCFGQGGKKCFGMILITLQKQQREK